VVSKQAGASDITDYSNNDKWFDDVSDGPVSAMLRMSVNGVATDVPVRGAWILVGPPDFAPDLPITVTLWDVLVDMAVRQLRLPADEAIFRSGGSLARLTAMASELARGAVSFTAYKPSFDDDVAPILRQAVMAMWAFEPLQYFHSTMGAGSLPPAVWQALSDPAQSNSSRDTIFKRVRKPGTEGVGVTADMPHLLGDDPYNHFGTKRWGLSLTITQYAMLEAWSKGKFIKSALPSTSLFKPTVPLALTPEGMDRAAAQSCSGGAFYPGIEVGWQIREPGLFSEPFRLKHGVGSKYVGDRPGSTVVAGHFSRQMALPWIADFLQCKQETQRAARQQWGWWPSQRPDGVYPSLAEARSTGTMLPWHRATVGASSNWPPDPPGAPPRDMPSYEQMRNNWTKFGFVVSGPSDTYFETERARSIP
jgi:hypothetical protein